MSLEFRGQSATVSFLNQHGILTAFSIFNPIVPDECSSHSLSKKLLFATDHYRKVKMQRILTTEHSLPNDTFARQLLHLRLRECRGSRNRKLVRTTGPRHLLV